MDPISFFLGNLVLGGLTNAGWDALKHVWQRITHKTWEDLLLDSFDAAFQEMRPSLAHYANNGEIGLRRQDLSIMLRHTLALDIGSLTPTEIGTKAFVDKLADAMTEQSVLTIGGHNLSRDDYLQLVRNTIAHARNEFRAAIIANDEAFRRAMIQAAEVNEAAVREVAALLGQEFDALRTQIGAIDAKLAAVVPRGVFLTLEAYRATLARAGRRLPFSENMVGREADLANATRLIENGTRVLIIDGDPGVGKTRFCFELAQALWHKPAFSDHGIRFVKETPSDLWQSIEAELQLDRPYIVVVDDANRIGNVALLRRILTNPERCDGSLLILNVRSYSRAAVVHNVRQPDFEGLSTLSLKQLSNTDIDGILNNPPFEFSREVRKHIVGLGKGNPRLAAVAAETYRKNGSLPNAQIELFKTYYEGVFDDLDQALQDKPNHKRLLGMIAALRSVNLDDAGWTAPLTLQLGFTNVQALCDAVGTLYDSEIVDLLPNRVARVFDENVSEYIVFRLFFEDRPGAMDYLRDVVHGWSRLAAQPVFENLVALRSKGYSSPRLTKLLADLLGEFRGILLSDSDAPSKLVTLTYMKHYVRSDPLACFELVQAYIQRPGPQVLSNDQALTIIDIAAPAMYLEWRALLERGANLLSRLSQHPDSSVSKTAHDRLMHLFKYIAWPADNNMVHYFYEPQSRLMAQIAGWITQAKNDAAIELCVDCLSQLCLHYAEHEEMDYLDDNTLTMAVWPLVLNAPLEKIRTSAFTTLGELYRRPSTSIALRLKIVKALESALDRSIPFGGSPSTELAKFDAGVLLPLIQPIANSERHLALLDHCSQILDSIEEQLQDGRASTFLSSIQSELLITFQKFTDSYWYNVRRAGLDFEIARREENEYLVAFGVGITPLDLVGLLSRIQEDATLEQPDLWRMHGFFTILGTRNSDAPREVLDLISGPQHPLQLYVPDLLASLSMAKPAARREVASKWLADHDIVQLRALAASYSWRDDNLDLVDVDILEALLGIDDPPLDWLLMQAFVAVEGVAPDRAAAALLKLTQRARPIGYARILDLVEPQGDSHGRSYGIYSSHPDVFRQIVFAGAVTDLADQHSIGRALGKCLEQLSASNLELLVDFLKERKKYCEMEQHEHRYVYTLLPPDTDLGFVRSRPQYGAFLGQILELVSQEDGRTVASYVDVLESILTGSIRRTSGERTADFDKTTLEVFARWAVGTPEQLRTVLKVLTHVHPWQTWLNIMRLVVQRQDLYELGLSHENLMSLLYSGAYGGSSTKYYQQRLALVRRQRRPDESIQMTQFFDHIETSLLRAIEREAEREQPEGELELEPDDL